MANKPTKEGFFWGKWKIKSPGTADEDDNVCFSEWEVMHVVENSSDETHPEYLMVMVPGVGKWQHIDNFYWGDCLEVVCPIK